MSTNRWLDELYNLREEDKARRQTEPEPLDLSVLTAQREKQAADVLRQADAHNLLRRVQRALLDGKGIIDIFEHKSNYERLITLVWQGSVSMARNPNPEDQWSLAKRFSITLVMSAADVTLARLFAMRMVPKTF